MRLPPDMDVDAELQKVSAELERRKIPPKLQFLYQPAPYKITYGGRGGAKSWSIARALLKLGTERKLRIVCARETMQSIRDSVHALLSDQVATLGYQDRYDVLQSTILGKNGSEFIFVGLHHNPQAIKSLEGADVLWVEEAQVVSKSSWDIAIPTIRKEGSEIWVSFNPELETDDTYKRFVLQPPPGAVVCKINGEDNPWFPERLRIESEHLKRTDAKSWAHIYGGECRSSVDGAVYGEEMAQAAEEKRIAHFPVDRTRPVDTFWDLGFGDMTAIWFAQAVDGWYHVVDYLEDSGKTIEHYLIQLQNRGYLYGNDWLPHDSVDAIIHKKLAGDRSRSIEMLMRNAGRSVRIVPKLYVHEGINAVRTILPQCRFDADKCADGLHALRRYQWGPKPENGVLKREPLHNEASHGADAFRALALGIKQPRKATPPKVQPMYRPASAWS